MINAYETEDGVVFDMSQLECDALRSYAESLSIFLCMGVRGRG